MLSFSLEHAISLYIEIQALQVRKSKRLDKVDQVAMRDLQLKLPQTKAHLRHGIPYITAFESLLELPIIRIIKFWLL